MRHRVVNYTEGVPGAAAVTHPALITKVFTMNGEHPPGIVNLRGVDPEGKPFQALAVHLLASGDPIPESGIYAKLAPFRPGQTNELRHAIGWKLLDEDDK